jgi:Na+-transporting methylmalonyl-CoA/oxaloacetate decarboxylase gamma subunit
MSLLAPAFAPVQTAALVLAQQPDSGDNGGQGEDFGKSSPVGFLLLLVFLVAVAFLVRSMTKHLKRVPATFDPEEQAKLDAEAASENGEPKEAEPKVAANNGAADKGTEKPESS